MDNDIEKSKQRAQLAVRGAVAVGILPSLRNGTIPCKDCGKPAAHYDHRDYAKPLEVESVCHKCNHKRGSAKGIVWRERREREVSDANDFWLSVNEFAQAVRLRSRTIYKAIRQKKIAAVRIASAIRIPRAVLRRLEQRAFVDARMDAIGCPPTPDQLDDKR